MEAREAALSAPTLEALRAILEGFDGCPLKHTATRLVFSDGNPQARLMFVGEAPGRDEDIEGKPFVGRSGKLLDRMMAAIGLDRSRRLYRQCRALAPAGQPHADAAGDRDLPALHPPADRARQSGHTGLPRRAVGADIARIKDGITKARGRWGQYDTGTRTIPALATFHPAYLLRTPLGKRMAWRDFLGDLESACRTAGAAGQTRTDLILRCERSEPRRMLTQKAAIGDGHPSRPADAGHLRMRWFQYRK